MSREDWRLAFHDNERDWYSLHHRLTDAFAVNVEAYVERVKQEAFEQGHKEGFTDGFATGYAHGYTDGVAGVGTDC